MDDDEIRLFAAGRPAAPPYDAQARDRARDRLLREARGRGGLRLPRLGWHAVAAFGITVTLVGGVAVALSGQGGAPDAATSATQSAAVSGEELEPKPGQFVLVESDTMYGATRLDDSGESRHLYQTHRKIWKSADGRAGGLLLIEGREAKPWPGSKQPPNVRLEPAESWYHLPSCPGISRNDHAYLSTLPADAAGMRELLYKRDGAKGDGAKGDGAKGDGAKGDGAKGDGAKGDADEAAFGVARELLAETYVPRAQRDALFEAMKSIGGVEMAEDVPDYAGRKGVALGRRSAQSGMLEQYIFDPRTHMLLGERGTVTDEKVAKAPVGSVLALTAQLRISVVDKLPDDGVATAENSNCDLPAPAETPDGGSPQPSAPPADTPGSPEPGGPPSAPSGD
ncbi:CU044_5270 family protein [Nonomuraea lactucae]|uniref:CU044_5270 family protein n=1 Tax=Nonomuraea lactucae TaxID=2249762 RepID=UPI000DE44F16|nr:CU044_5270 family protein [Nonomuraea lactucae]